MPVYDVTVKVTIDADSSTHAIACTEVLLTMAVEAAEVHEVKVYRNPVEWGES